jgi:hypothetical protein
LDARGTNGIRNTTLKDVGNTGRCKKDYSSNKTAKEINGNVKLAKSPTALALGAITKTQEREGKIMALGTITGLLTKINTQQGRPKMYKMELTCTAGAAGDGNAHLFPATVINPLALDGAGRFTDIRGLKFYSVKAYPGDPAPTDATDLTITDEYGIDLLGGKGTDLIDATSKTWIPIGPAGYALPALITGNITVNITNNSVNSAVVNLVLELVGD